MIEKTETIKGICSQLIGYPVFYSKLLDKYIVEIENKIFIISKDYFEKVMKKQAPDYPHEKNGIDK